MCGGYIPCAGSPVEHLVPVATSDEVERSDILAALQQADGVVDGTNGAAKILDPPSSTFRHRMSKLGIQSSSHRQS